MKRLGPELKLPKLKRSGSGAAGPKGPSVSVPPLVADVYYDLRERRLLPLVALVIVAILAVPFLLGDPEEPAPPPTAVQSAEEAVELEVAGDRTLTVVQAKPGLRDYRKRLRGRTPTDPFRQKYSSVPATSRLQSTAVESAPPVSSANPVNEDSTDVSVTDEGETVTVEVEEDGDSGGPPPSDGGSKPGGNRGSGDGGNRSDDDGTQFFAYRPDVRFGVAGGDELREYEDLPIASLLPKENPVLFFIGATEAGDRVVFDVSSEVILVKDGGKCIGGRQSCGLLFIGPGEAVTLRTETPGRTFRLAVDSIDFVPIERPKPAGSSSADGSELPGLSQNFSK
ncbi:MAG TPA: hypothetical protein VFY04_03225 [Solirubrobacterales bacterium]|nr:hypothetical protein [Solirubrobacterales bacterium]